jgi:ribosomal protein S18 acetylase RimI-like enzyme
MKLSTMSGEVRAFTKQDILQVADLHRRVFSTADHASPELTDSYQRYFTQIFLDDAWRDDDTQSLVYEEQGGKITGFFGAVARQMSFNGQAVRAKVGSQAMVDPDSSGLAGLKLYSAFLDGPQDLFIGDEANSSVRPLWEGFGGTTSLLYSTYWMYPLRPCRFARFVLTEKKLLPPLLSRMAAPATWMLDALAAPFLKKLSGSSEGRLVGEDLTCEKLLRCIAECAGTRSLRPVYDQLSLGRILHRAERLQRNGRLQKVLLKTEAQETAGWYLYYLNREGLSEVVQLYANPGFAHAVLDHLFQHAESQGATVLRGRLEPSLLHALSDRRCLFHFGPAWALVYSKRPELLHALDRGDALFSRLEGEWCLHFQ